MALKRAYDDVVYHRRLPPVRDMDAGTRGGRRAMLQMVRQALREAREAFAVGLHEDALDCLLHALRVKRGLDRYYRMRRTILSDPRYNVCGPVAW